MSLKDQPRFRLYRLEEVASIFTEKPTTKVREQVRQLAEQFGTYRRFGDEMLFSEADVEALLKCIRARTDLEAPSDDTPGFVLLLGSRTSVEADVLVVWAQLGSVESTAQLHENTSGAQLIDYAPATYGQFRAWEVELKPDRMMGKWYGRTKSFNAWVAKVWSPTERKDV